MVFQMGTLAVISGFSGVGKGTIVKSLLRKYPAYCLSVSATTRQPRPGEIPDVSYHFITTEEFERRIREGDFLEWARYVDHYYGTPKKFVMDKLWQGRDVILEIESEGAMKVKAQFPEAVLIFVLPPSMKELRRRLEGRGTESPDKITRRLQKAVTEEIGTARQYDFAVVNDDLKTCVEEVHRIIQTRQGVHPSQTNLLDVLEKEPLV